MAKKSNKTEHVLKLITKNDESAQDDDFFVMEEEIFENGTSAIRNVKQPEPETDRAEIELSVVPTAEKEPTPAPVPVSQVEPPTVPEEPPHTEPAAKLPAEKPPAAAPPHEPPTLKAFREQASAVGSAIMEQNDDLVNIAEILAREKLSLVMERMKVCTCKTCTNDVLALALNSLPTKYVTTDAGKQYFQLDVYKKQYETDILAALTKACVRVKASPRH
jgi:competence protein ComFB